MYVKNDNFLKNIIANLASLIKLCWVINLYLINFFYRHADATIMNKEIHTPLLCAAIRGNLESYEELVGSGVDVKDVDANGKNVIHLAAEKGHDTFLKVRSR